MPSKHQRDDLNTTQSDYLSHSRKQRKIDSFFDEFPMESLINDTLKSELVTLKGLIQSSMEEAEKWAVCMEKHTSDTVIGEYNREAINKLETLQRAFIEKYTRSLGLNDSLDEVEPVNKSLPFAIGIKTSNFFVRDCYKEYFKLINEIMPVKFDYITICGTPGIGKSVFYNYFFRRYRIRYPETTVVTASFTSKRKMKGCLEFKPGSEEGEVKTEIPKIPNAMYLYDGVPEMEPSVAKMVCFCSPNEGWLKVMSKFEGHTALYMPTWEYEELQRANEVCGFNILEDELESRFRFFGGVARFCLCNSDSHSKQAESKTKAAIKKVSRNSDLVKIFDNVSQVPAMSHRVFHLKPVNCSFTKRPEYYQVSFGSEEIGILVLENIMQHEELDSEKFKNMLKDSVEASFFVGQLFEYRCKRELKRGFKMEIRGMDDDSTELIELKSGDFVSLHNKFPAIDGYHFVRDTNILLMFQITMNYNHPIKVIGIRKLLKSLELDERFNDIKVKLVFVVASGMNGYTTQEYEGDAFVSMSSRIESVFGRKHRLISENGPYKTVGELIESKSEVENIVSARKKAIKVLNDEEQLHRFIKSIPQYVTVTEFDYKMNTKVSGYFNKFRLAMHRVMGTK